jgi:beta-lactam-binding protein with PASTA domain
VVGTNPPAGTAVDVGSTITLLIKPAAPSPSPSPSPSAS